MSTCELTDFAPQQCHENDLAQIVLVHCPGIESLLGSLHACGSLFEKPVNLEKARNDHQTFQQAMSDKGIKVLTVRQILGMNCDKDLRYRLELEDLAAQVLSYNIHLGTDVKQLSNVQRYFLSDEYKRECLSALGVNDLIDIILIGPSVLLASSRHNTPLRIENLSMKPLLNLTFQRDQQIVTNKGLIISKMGSPQRKPETMIMKYCFKKLNIKVLGEIGPEGLLEGGDFIPAGPDLCFIGTGLRTNQVAIDQLLENDWFGTRRVAVVKDVFDWDQQRMHLDTVFNICSENCCVMLETIMGMHSPIRRLVTEYTKGENGKYFVSKRQVEFSEYVKQEGYYIIPITDKQQRAYGINFLNLGNGYIISVDQSTARTMLKCKQFTGSIQVIDFSGMTTMYGSVHCCSQVLLRNQSKTQKILKVEKSLINKNVYQYTESKKLSQVTNNVLLVVPSYCSEFWKGGAVKQCRKEFSWLYQRLTACGINVTLIPLYQLEDTRFSPFPARLFSTHSSHETKGEKTVVLYPLKSIEHRRERRKKLLDTLHDLYPKFVDLTKFESEKKSLEASNIVFDRLNKIAFVALTPLSNIEVSKQLANELGYEIVTFELEIESSDTADYFYQTSSVLFIGTSFVIVCSECISEKHREHVLSILQSSGKQIIEISKEQRLAYCTSVVELSDQNGENVLVLSKRAFSKFSDTQQQLLQKHVKKIVTADISNIEDQGNESIASIIAVLF